MNPSPPVEARRPLLWLGVLYFASGLPNGIVTDTAPTLFKERGVALGTLGALALTEMPWILKFLWAPLLDRWGGRKVWIAACQAALAGLLVAFAFTDARTVGPEAWVLLVAMAFASATQDVAIDAHAVEATPPRLLGPANSARVTAYRLALFAAGTALLGRAPDLGWKGTWLVAAGGILAFLVATAFVPAAPRAPVAGRPFGESFRRLSGRPGFGSFLAFVFLFKVGDYLMSRMTSPALLDGGFTVQQKADWINPAAMGALILGAVVGGAYAKRAGVFRALWVLGLLQALSNLGYALAVGHGKAGLFAAAVVEPFCSGLGVAPFLALLMLSCDREHAGPQFALLTAVMGLGRVLAGLASGKATEWMGYAPWFAVTFAAALPAYALLPRVRTWIEDRERAPGIASPR
jgi:PAT family beta-lactamase induction signal transducer AmpG